MRMEKFSNDMTSTLELSMIFFHSSYTLENN